MLNRRKSKQTVKGGSPADIIGRLQNDRLDSISASRSNSSGNNSINRVKKLKKSRFDDKGLFESSNVIKNEKFQLEE